MAKFFMTKQKFIHQWLRHFAPGLSKPQYDKYVKNQFIWHVFSFNLLPSGNLLVGDAARHAYDMAEKSNCIFCIMFGKSGVTDTFTSCFDSASTIDAKFTELYVIAKDFSWTYIKTHEGDFCGPYFLTVE